MSGADWNNHRLADRTSLAFRAGWGRVAIASGALGAYGLAFFPVHALAGSSAVTLALLPVVVAAQLLGMAAGLLTGLFCIPVNLLLLNLAGQPGWTVLTRSGGGALGTVLLVLVGGVVGRMSDLGRRVTRELDARRRAEEHLRLQSAALEAAANAILITDRGGIILWANPAFTHLTGYVAEEVIGQTPHLLRSGEQDASVYEGLWATILAGQPWQGTLINRRKDGSLYTEEQTITPVRDAQGKVTHFIAIKQDITERRRAEQALHLAEARFRTLVEQIPAVTYVAALDESSATLYVSPQVESLGYTPAEWLAHPDLWSNSLHPDDREGVLAELHRCQASGKPFSAEYRMVTREGHVCWIHDQATVVRDPAGKPMFLQGVMLDLTERKRAEADLREADRRAIREYGQLLERLARLGQAAGTATDVHSIYRSVREFAEASVPCNGLFVALYDPERQQRTCVYSGGDGEEDDVSALPPMPMNDGPQSQAIVRKDVVLTDDLQRVYAEAGITPVTLGLDKDPRLPQSSLAIPLMVKDRVVGAFEVQSIRPAAYTTGHVTAMRMAACLAAIATENVQALARERQARLAAQASEARYRALAEGAHDAIFLVGRDDCLQYANSFAAGLVGARPEQVIGQPRAALFPPGVARQQERGVQTVFDTGQPVYAEVLTPFPDREVWLGTWLAPIHDAAQAVDAVLGIARDITVQKQAEDQIKLQLERLAALRTIDTAIAGSLDVRLTLSILLDCVTAQLHVDAVDVLLRQPGAHTLAYAAGRGFRTDALRATRLRLGEGHAGQAARERRAVHIPDLRALRTDFLRSAQFAQEAFVTYRAVPLLARGQVVGVMEIFHRAPLEPDREWLEFLDALACQAALAIDNAALFDGLQRSNLDLTVAYDSTIEGWSRALDLRDHDTEGHTRRVTEMTLRLARAMGLGDEALVHIRRGALLHDIGKMGVPDAVLHKPGPLTDAEWAVMRRHPQLALDLLAPIEFLRPALDIPFCHHERWDGSGYPRGLRGEAIPLAARVFAVADVWDALTSDRPYRKAWPAEKALEHMRAQAGKHFDPAVVEAFLAMRAGGSGP